MIYIRGDTHGEISAFSEEAMPGQSQWTQDDTLIVTGDFGFVMLGEEEKWEEKRDLDALAEKPYTILFCDGNHEGFDSLEKYPEVMRYGAPVRQIRHNVFWLQRGYGYVIEGKRFFVMGGAHSMDIDFRRCYEKISGKRIWFPQELPSGAEYRRAAQTLRDWQNKMDCVISHTGPRSILHRLYRGGEDLHDAELTGFLDWVYYYGIFDKWYFGHHHVDERFNDQVTACYQLVHRFPD